MSEYIIEIPDYVPPFDPVARAASLGDEIVRCRNCRYRADKGKNRLDPSRARMREVVTACRAQGMTWAQTRERLEAEGIRYANAASARVAWCKYSKRMREGDISSYCTLTTLDVAPGDYCSRGERRAES